MSTKAEKFKSDAQRTGHPHHVAPEHAASAAAKPKKPHDASTGAVRKEQMTQATPENQARRSIARDQKVRGGTKSP